MTRRMNYGVTIWTIESLLRMAPQCATGLPDGRYVPARSLGWTGIPYRLRAAWMVFRGRADVVVWEQQS
jgi:hypothetical protein